MSKNYIRSGRKTHEVLRPHREPGRAEGPRSKFLRDGTWLRGSTKQDRPRQVKSGQAEHEEAQAQGQKRE